MTERLYQIPTRPGMGRSLIEHDERSKNFRGVDRLRGAVSELKPKDKVWRRGGPYDQGMTSTCVAQTGKGLLNTLPLSQRIDYDIRSQYSIDEFYDGAQEYDEWPGNAYDGTSGLGLCRYLQKTGKIDEYLWYFGLHELLLGLSYQGPVGIGIWWWSDMFDPRSDGLITPTGEKEGGHEVELIGLDVSDKVVIGMNSWGKNWGDKGRFRIRWADLEHLLLDEGDAFSIVK